VPSRTSPWGDADRGRADVYDYYRSATTVRPDRTEPGPGPPRRTGEPMLYGRRSRP